MNVIRQIMDECRRAGVESDRIADIYKYDKNTFMKNEGNFVYIVDYNGWGTVLFEDWCLDGDWEEMIGRLQYAKQQMDRGEGYLFFLGHWPEYVYLTDFQTAFDWADAWRWGPFYRFPTIVHDLVDKTDGKLDQTLLWAMGQGIQNNLLDKIEYLRNYGRKATRCYLYQDFAPMSFYFEMHKYYQRTGKWERWFNGGLIFHGDHDRGGDGGAPTFSVNLTPMTGWQIHT